MSIQIFLFLARPFTLLLGAMHRDNHNGMCMIALSKVLMLPAVLSIQGVRSIHFNDLDLCDVFVSTKGKLSRI